MARKTADEKAPQKFKGKLSAGEVLATILWNCARPVLRCDGPTLLSNTTCELSGVDTSVQDAATQQLMYSQQPATSDLLLL